MENYDTQPDEKGHFMRVEFCVRDAGQVVKITKLMRRRVVQTRVKRAIWERRHWAGFGDTAAMETIVSPLLVDFDLGTEKEEKKSDINKPLVNSIIKCGKCGQPGHFTFKCTSSLSLPIHSKNFGASSSSASPPPLQQEPTLKISNLSADATEDDLRELCRRFGSIYRVSIVRDKETGESHGLGFVHFSFMGDAVRAVKGLHKHPYDNQILDVELARPRERKERK